MEEERKDVKFSFLKVSTGNQTSPVYFILQTSFYNPSWNYTFIFEKAQHFLYKIVNFSTLNVQYHFSKMLTFYWNVKKLIASYEHTIVLINLDSIFIILLLLSHYCITLSSYNTRIYCLLYFRKIWTFLS